jgi:hypothetical protein
MKIRVKNKDRFYGIIAFLIYIVLNIIFFANFFEFTVLYK